MILIDEMAPMPDADDPDLEGVSRWSVPGSDVRVLTWVEEGGSSCWAATEDRGGERWYDNGLAPDPDSAFVSGSSCAAWRVSTNIEVAYWRRLISGSIGKR